MANDKVITSQALVQIFEKCLADKWGYIWGTAGVLWTQARQTALEKTTDENRKMSRKYGGKWIGHWVADCSGMFVYAFKQFGKGMSHISSNIYISYCDNKGALTAEKKKALRPGTAVFTGDSAKKHPHVGLYVGGGNVIEAKGTIAGVIKSSIDEKRWTWWGELKGVQYDGAAPQPEKQEETGKTMQTIRKGNKGALVTKLQEMLQELGYSLGICGIDGDFGVATEKAVKEFQKNHDGPDGRALAIDGVVGPATWAALEAAVKGRQPEEPAEEKYTVTIRGLTKGQADELCRTWKEATMAKE